MGAWCASHSAIGGASDSGPAGIATKTKHTPCWGPIAWVGSRHSASRAPSRSTRAPETGAVGLFQLALAHEDCMGAVATRRTRPCPAGRGEGRRVNREPTTEPPSPSKAVNVSPTMGGPTWPTQLAGSAALTRTIGPERDDGVVGVFDSEDEPAAATFRHRRDVFRGLVLPVGLLRVVEGLLPVQVVGLLHPRHVRGSAQRRPEQRAAARRLAPAKLATRRRVCYEEPVASRPTDEVPAAPLLKPLNDRGASHG